AGAARGRRLPHWLLLLREGRHESRGIAAKVGGKPIPAVQQVRPGAVDAREHLASNRKEGVCGSLLRADRAKSSLVAAGAECQEPLEDAARADSAARCPSGCTYY